MEVHSKYAYRAGGKDCYFMPLREYGLYEFNILLAKLK